MKTWHPEQYELAKMPVQTDPNEFIRSYAIFLNIVEEFIIEVMKRNQPVDNYGILIQEALNYVVQQVL